MHDAPLGPANTVWTLGHSNHPLETFLALLAQHRVELVIDVRSSPYSGYASQFNREAIRPALRDRAVEYWFLGDSLGGHPDDQQFLDDQGHVLYGRLAESAGFRQGIQWLLDAAAQSRVAIFCGEENPANCHRRLLVGRVLRERGVSIVHIRGDGRVQTESELAAEEDFRKTKGQLSLFDTEEPDPWKSIQSVSPKKAPPISSEPCNGPEFGA